jgi:hypothetical protein
MRKLADAVEGLHEPGRARASTVGRLAGVAMAISSSFANYYTNKLDFLKGLVAAFAQRAASIRGFNT